MSKPETVHWSVIGGSSTLCDINYEDNPGTMGTSMFNGVSCEDCLRILGRRGLLSGNQIRRQMGLDDLTLPTHIKLGPLMGTVCGTISGNFAKTIDQATCNRCREQNGMEVLAEWEIKLINDHQEAPLDDPVNHPKHYSSDPSGVECITITRHRNFNVGQVFKYFWRAGLKSDSSLSDKEKEIQDMEKGVWYAIDEICRLKGITREEYENEQAKKR